MGPGNQGRSSPHSWRALAGIEAGVLGGLVMFGWLGASVLFDMQSIWVVPNLLGSLLSGRTYLQRGFGWVTVSGLGLHLFVSGLIGLLFGLVTGDSRNRLRVLLSGVVTGLVWYYFSQILFWRKLGALAMIYSPPRPLLFGHMLFGLVLGLFPARLKALRRSLPGAGVELVQVDETPASPDTVE